MIKLSDLLSSKTLVMKSEKERTYHDYYWVYQNSLDKIVFFDYQEGRCREGPTPILQNLAIEV